MARRRDTDLVSFDVSYGAGLEDGFDASGGAGDVPGGPERGPSWRDRWRAASPRRRRRIVGSAGAALVVAVGGVSVAGAVQAHVDAERLRESPGGVVSLDGDLTEVWSTGGGVAAVLAGGGLVGIDGTEAVARAVADGAELWRVELGEAPECGPSPRLGSSVEWTLTADVVTCLHGPDGERTATVLHADGAVVGQRDLDPERYGADVEVVPAADGALAVAALETPAWVGREFDSQQAADEALARSRDSMVEAAVHVEDALTGDVRSELDLDDGGLTWSDCAGVAMSGEPGEPERAWILFDGSTRPTATPAVVGYRLCGTAGAVTAAGTALDLKDAIYVGFDSLGTGGDVSPFPGGGIVVPRGGAGSAVVAEDGSERLADLTRRVLVPSAQVGDPEPEPEALAVPDGRYGLVGVDGIEVRWERELPGDVQVLARTDGTSVLSVTDYGNDGSGLGALVGLDDADGTERWRVELGEPDGDDGAPYWVQVTSAVTDGGRITAAVTAATGTTWEAYLLTVDLATGDERRQDLGTEVFPLLSAVDGHLLLHELDPYGDPVGDGIAVETVRVLEPR
ncbi:hypothetical protein GCM10023216_28050 [Isoptericola chiayiensis]|uniref:Pyrroloquinoline-quinone binding quinoprotein n=1 Tax=Isoptericola chiayiensis TaxID=579446 RepID=A0ABP8YPN4_9MICO|nr:hypothetical protein [Isoptericola chiayiensis]NOW02274.1 hypothetical protein [Isoptericola chiayiensis]